MEGIERTNDELHPNDYVHPIDYLPHDPDNNRSTPEPPLALADPEKLWNHPSEDTMITYPCQHVFSVPPKGNLSAFVVIRIGWTAGMILLLPRRRLRVQQPHPHRTRVRNEYEYNDEWRCSDDPNHAPPRTLFPSSSSPVPMGTPETRLHERGGGFGCDYRTLLEAISAFTRGGGDG